MNKEVPPTPDPDPDRDPDHRPQGLGEIGLSNFEPYLMNRIMGRYNASLRDDMGRLGLTTAKMRTLAVLSVMDGPVIRELSVYAVVEQSTLSRALDTLATEGFVRREAHEQDTRATRIYITDVGRAAFERLWPQMADAYAQMFQGVTHTERAVFLTTLHKMLKNVRKHDL